MAKGLMTRLSVDFSYHVNLWNLTSLRLWPHLFILFFALIFTDTFVFRDEGGQVTSKEEIISI